MERRKRRRRPAGDEGRAVAYVRVSTDEQQLGPEAQRRDIERWAKARGVQVVAWREDRAVSGGAELDKRPGLMAALDDLAAHRAGLLVVAKRDRLARDLLKAGAIEAMATARGGRVVSADGAADGNDPTAVLMRQLLDAFAQFERAMIRSRISAAMRVMSDRGEYVGKPPLGKRLGDELVRTAKGKVKPVLVEDERETVIIERARALRSRGLSIRTIVTRLAEEGHLSRTGRPFRSHTVHTMVRGVEARRAA
ncbi:MAG TPA: recombinase family protein [Anaeromyxobacteraceae bacterium]|nr:recombinase family protein [Anaeromyxobacteraceae bacterium]